MIQIRPIDPADNFNLANIIRTVLAEFNANHPGTVYFDASTDALSDLFQYPRSSYWVAERDGEVIGGGGIYPTEGLPSDTCELVKMYLLPQARGEGIGRMLMECCLNSARELGFKRVYLETMPELRLALPVYAHFGFRYLEAPMGASGHFGCPLWMLKELDQI